MKNTQPIQQPIILAEDIIFQSHSEGARSYEAVENCHLHHMYEQRQSLLCLNKADCKYFTLQQALYHSIQEL